MVDWYYIFSILPLGVYPSPKTIYNVGAKGTYYFVNIVDSCEPHVTTCLPSGLVSQAPQGLGEIVTREVAG